MNEDEILKYVIAFILGWLASRMIGNGFSVGGKRRHGHRRRYGRRERHRERHRTNKKRRSPQGRGKKNLGTTIQSDGDMGVIESKCKQMTTKKECRDKIYDGAALYEIKGDKGGPETDWRFCEWSDEHNECILPCGTPAKKIFYDKQGGKQRTLTTCENAESGGSGMPAGPTCPGLYSKYGEEFIKCEGFNPPCTQWQKCTPSNKQIEMWNNHPPGEIWN